MIISGGQTGADQAGLAAAVSNNIATGGYAPKGWVTKLGPNPELLRDKYKLIEHPSSGYKDRTWANVEASTGTIRCCVDFWSAGEICTLNAVNHYRRPIFDIYILNPPHIDTFIIWMKLNNISILNVAGNADGKRGYDIFTLTFDYLNIAFKQYLLSFNTK